jgi:hypothetical protein
MRFMWEKSNCTLQLSSKALVPHGATPHRAAKVLARNLAVGLLLGRTIQNEAPHWSPQFFVSPLLGSKVLAPRILSRATQSEWKYRISGAS